MNPSPPEAGPGFARPAVFRGLVSLACPNCGTGLWRRGWGASEKKPEPRELESSEPRHPEPAVFPCPGCGRSWEPSGDHLEEVVSGSVRPTSRVPVSQEITWLPVWCFRAVARVEHKRSGSLLPPDAVVRRLSADSKEGFRLYVPAFSLVRITVAQLGAGLTEAQPRVQAEDGLPVEARESVSPVLLSEVDARVVAHFVYLTVESRATRELRGIDYDLRLEEGALLFFPAEYDVRFVRNSNWRLLLHEFDPLVV